MLLLAVLLGGAVGSVATIGIHGRRHENGRRPGSDWYVRTLSRELQLSGEQQDSVRAVLARHRGGMDSMWVEMAPRMKDWREGVRADVRALLTPEQQARYADLTARLDAEREHRARTDSTHR
jgi:hypothetical protein